MYKKKVFFLTWSTDDLLTGKESNFMLTLTHMLKKILKYAHPCGKTIPPCYGPNHSRWLFSLSFLS